MTATTRRYGAKQKRPQTPLARRVAELRKKGLTDREIVAALTEARGVINPLKMNRGDGR
jgi:hypothetical protein